MKVRGSYISICKILRDVLNDGNYKVHVTVSHPFATHFRGGFLLLLAVENSKDVNRSRGIWVLIIGGFWPLSVVRPIFDWEVKYSPL